MSASPLPLHPPGFLSRSLPHASSPACQHRSVITAEMSTRLRNTGFRSISSCLGEVWGRLHVHDVRPGSGKPDTAWLTFLCTDPHQASIPGQSARLSELARATGERCSLSCSGKASLSTGACKKYQSSRYHSAVTSRHQGG